MRITHNLLYKFAHETIKKRKRSEPDLLAAYLMGSLLTDDPLLGGTTDIDLVLVHKYQAPVANETVAITPEISLDIYHKIQDDYEKHRHFRQDPWMGYPLTQSNILLFDTNHWLEFIQSSVCANFHRSDNVLARVGKLSSAARDKWFTLTQLSPQTYPDWLHQYLEILSLAANAVVGLIGPPLTTRRFMKTFQQQTDLLGVPKIMAGLYGLLGLSEDFAKQLPGWIEGLEKDLTHLAHNESIPPHLAMCRHAYYLNALRYFSASEQPSQAGWPLLRIWCDAQLASSEPLPSIELWENYLKTLGLTQDTVDQKLHGLDAFLDNVEIVIESWTDAYGI